MSFINVKINWPPWLQKVFTIIKITTTFTAGMAFHKWVWSDIIEFIKGL